ncbi:hypothetical protein M9H77_04684 [Catharanthus roseus]|uniref:Uncharacterized protein n=1 Tax=Catharanthus roseus TaxID=4058 RepID=A0ACC0CFB8_CATRO|nr:hypothetical protein M9H77_04684 [Catharanthus roseus]
MINELIIQREEDKVYQFLIGLDDSMFGTVRIAVASSDAVAFEASRAIQNLVHSGRELDFGAGGRRGRERMSRGRGRSLSESFPATAGWAAAASAHRTGGTVSGFSNYDIHWGSPSLLLSLKTHLQEEPASEVPLFSTVSSDNKLNYDFGEIPGVQLSAKGRNIASRSWPAQPTGMDQPIGSPGPRQDCLVQSTAIVQNDHLSRRKKVQQIETHQTIPSPLAEDQHMSAAGASHPSEGPLQLELRPREEWPGPRGNQLGQSLGSTNSQQETSSQPETVNIEGNLELTHIDSSSSNHNYSSDSSASFDIGQQNVVEPINLRRNVIGYYCLDIVGKNYVTTSYFTGSI